VALRYGEFGSADFLVVVTDAKLPQHQHGDVFVGPTGQFDARHMAQLELSAMTVPRDAPATAAAEEAQAAGNGLRIGDPIAVELLVEGHPVTFEASTRGGIWAADADLGQVALAVYGAMRPGDVSLAPVYADLDAFLAME
jgi:hypothetical protein